MSREVMERDLRAPEFRQGDADEYEFRDDGKIVRKDRFIRGMQDIASIIFGSRHDYEIGEVVAAVHRLKGVQALAAIDGARYVYEDDPKALEVLDYVKAVIDNPKESA
jgi:hypothetical protein